MTGLIAVAAALLIVYIAAILRKYICLIIKVVDDQALFHENGNGENAPLKGSIIRFQATDGWELEGVLLTSDKGGPPREWGTGKGIVIFAHEFGSDRSSCLRYCRSLLEADFDVLAFDFRGHGNSSSESEYRPRQWPTDRETADMRGAIKFVESHLRRINSRCRIGLYGLSRGACAAILAAGKNDLVQAIVADGAYSSDLALEFFMRRFAPAFARIRVIARNHPAVFWRFLRWLLMHEYSRRFGCRFPSVRKAIVRMGRKPILFIHGEKDSYIPYSHCQTLYELAHGPKSLWIVPGAKHNQSIKAASSEYARRMVGFFEEHLVGAAQSAREVRRRTVERSEVPAMTAPSLDYGGVLVGARFAGPNE